MSEISTGLPQLITAIGVKTMNTLKIKRLKENAVIPSRATSGSAGLDLYACLDEEVTIAPRQTVLFHTGIAIELPSSGYAAFIYARSGLGIKHGIIPANCVGVIDSDYRGEICVGLYNFSDSAYTVKPRDRIAQMVIAPVAVMDTEETCTLSGSQRADGGFGSSGK